ncbi:MAG: HEAT repeat domain-containing protein [Planctomycetia bacterium]|nr:HEAT repeat domain-containing protein [Planctomycetia bacterium]
MRVFVHLFVVSLLLGAAAISWAADAGASEKKGLKAISVPPGFTVELAAGAPLVERPMLAAFDDRGRLYVADSAGVNLRGPELSKNPPHVIRMLEDTDGDGRFDKSTVFADKMVFPQGVVWHDGAVYCSSPPSFWRLQDTDGDGVADQREELVTGFANTGVADDMHGGSLGPDGRIYWCAGRFPHQIQRPGGPVIHKGIAPLVLRCRPDGSDLEVVCGSQGNAVGVVFTPCGDMFASGTFLAPNSMGAGLRDALVHCIDGAEYPVRDRTLHEHKRTGELLPPLTHLGVAAASDLMICRGNALGEDFHGNLFSALFNMHKIMRHRLERDGATFKCRNEDFLVSSDPDFHPTDVFEDADGSMLVIDTGAWFLIGCPTSQISKPSVMGGIYRIRKSGAKPSVDPRGLTIAWTSLSANELVKLLGDSRFEVRDRAIAQLAKLGARAVRALASAVSGDGSLQSRCGAVWALTRIDGDDARAAVRTALVDAKPSVRQAAARSAGLHRDREALERLMAIVTSDEPVVRREAATALGRIGQPSAVAALLDGLNSSTDRFLEHALIFALIRIGDRPNTLKGLAMAGSPVKRGALIALDQMDGGQLTPDVVTPFLAPTDPLLHETALWVIAHHGEWGRAMLDFFRQWLARSDMDETRRDELKLQLLAFAKDSAVQDLVAATLDDPRTQLETRLLLLEVMAQAPITKFPKSWAGQLQQALEHANEQVVRQAVATLRALPLDKRPLVSRVDPQVNFEPTGKRFAGTRLSENFCVRWMGTIRCPKDSTYVFYTESDDGSQLFVDGKMVVDNGGSHGMRERQGRLKLATGDHDLRIEFIQGEGQAGCKMAWAFDGRAKEIIPADVLWHRPRSKSTGPAELQPGLVADFFELGGRLQTFPDLASSEFDGRLLRVAMDAGRPIDIRVQSAAAVAPRLGGLDQALFSFLVSGLDKEQTPLVRLDAAEALGKAHLDDIQLKALCAAVAAAGVLEVPKLLQAFEQSKDSQLGEELVAALSRSAGLKSLQAEALVAALQPYGDAVRQQAEPLLQQLSVNSQKQQARLVELQDVLGGGDIQRGRDLFFGNKKAICATCHAVQGQGGKIGPDLTKIGAIRAPRDLLEAIVFPSASFARGYEPFTVATDDGQVISGIIARETADAIYLFNNSRIEVRVLRSSIESLGQSNVSIMPEGMDAQLGRQELADLIAFLQSLR